MKPINELYSVTPIRAKVFHQLETAILSGDLDDCPESAFFNAGTIDDVLRRAKGVKGGGQ